MRRKEFTRLVRGIPGRRLWFKIRRRDRDYFRLFQQTKRQGFFERLDGFAAASVRSREPTAEKTAPYLQTIRRLWFKPALPHGKGLPKGSPFPWRRDRDLNPGRHHCLTRFRIVRVQPLRHLCIDGRRAPEMQTSFYRKSAKKATDFAPSREIFCWMLHFLPPSMREVARCPRLALGNVTEGVCRITSKTPSVSLRSTASRAVEPALGQEISPQWEISKLESGQSPTGALSRKHFLALKEGATGACVFLPPRRRFFG